MVQLSTHYLDTIIQKQHRLKVRCKNYALNFFPKFTEKQLMGIFLGNNNALEYHFSFSMLYLDRDLPKVMEKYFNYYEISCVCSLVFSHQL